MLVRTVRGTISHRFVTRLYSQIIINFVKAPYCRKAADRIPWESLLPPWYYPFIIPEILRWEDQSKVREITIFGHLFTNCLGLLRQRLDLFLRFIAFVIVYYFFVNANRYLIYRYSFRLVQPVRVRR